MIITGGENVFPSEVENCIGGYPKVKDVAVIGVPHEKWGESVMAVVVLHEGQTATPEEISGYCKGKIAGFKVPKTGGVRGGGERKDETFSWSFWGLFFWGGGGPAMRNEYRLYLKVGDHVVHKRYRCAGDWASWSRSGGRMYRAVSATSASASRDGNVRVFDNNWKVSPAAITRASGKLREE